MPLKEAGPVIGAVVDAVPAMACTPLENANDMNGKIVMIGREYMCVYIPMCICIYAYPRMYTKMHSVVCVSRDTTTIRFDVVLKHIQYECAILTLVTP